MGSEQTVLLRSQALQWAEEAGKAERAHMDVSACPVRRNIPAAGCSVAAQVHPSAQPLNLEPAHVRHLHAEDAMLTSADIYTQPELTGDAAQFSAQVHWPAGPQEDLSPAWLDKASVDSLMISDMAGLGQMHGNAFGDGAGGSLLPAATAFGSADMDVHATLAMMAEPATLDADTQTL